MDFTDLIKIYGPLAMGWVIACYLIKFILDRYSADIEARAKLASALDNLSNIVNHQRHD